MNSFRRALRRWLRRDPGPTDDARDAADTAALEAFDRRWIDDTDPLLHVSSLDPAEVGRQVSRGAAILDVAAWLEVSGWDDVERGELQQWAEWLLEKRAAYEQQGALL